MNKRNQKHTSVFLVAFLYLVIYMPVDTNAQNTKNDTTKNVIKSVGVNSKNDIDIKINFNIFRVKKPTLIIKYNIMLDPIITGSLIGAGASGINAALQASQNRKNRRFQREMFDKTNEYNTPLNQVKRLKEGGLNPALMYGSGAGSAISSSKADQPSAPQTQAYQIPETLFADIAQKLASAQVSMAKSNEISSTLPLKLSDLQSIITTRNNFQQPLLSAQAHLAGVQSANLQTERDMNIMRTMTEADYKNKLMSKLDAEIKNIHSSTASLNQARYQSGQLFPLSKQAQELANQHQRVNIQTAKQHLANLPQEQKQVMQKFLGEIENLTKQGNSIDWHNLFQSYSEPFRKAGINPDNNTMLDFLTKAGTFTRQPFINKYHLNK